MNRRFSAIYLIGKVSFVELLREKFFLISMLLGVLVILISLILGQMTVNEHDRILADLGLSAIELSSVFMCIFIGSYLVAKEIDRQTCLLVLARPITRLDFILGKILSIVTLYTFSILFLSIVLYFLLGKWDLLLNLILASFSIWGKSLVVLLLTILLSQVLQPSIASFVGISIYILGHWIPDLIFFANKSKDAVFMRFATSIDWITPNFYKFNWKSYEFLLAGTNLAEVAWTLVYILSWMLLSVTLINSTFRRRDIA